MRSLRTVLFCVAAITAACSQQGGMGQGAGGSVDPVVGTTTSPMRAGETDAIGSSGAIPVVVIGSVFGLDRGTLEQAIAKDMQGAGWANARFVPSAVGDESARSKNYRVVMLLNPPVGADVGTYCGDSAASAFPGPATTNVGTRDVELRGVLCRNGKDLRQVQTGVDGVSSLDDPAFRKMVAEATTELTLSSGESDVFHGSDQDR